MTTLDFMMELHDLTTGSVDIAISELFDDDAQPDIAWSGWHSTLLLRYSSFFHSLLPIFLHFSLHFIHFTH